jgi:glycosyltransferase involved in cell wall biosynthesis
MRIGIDFHLAERTGTGNCTYMRNLVEALVKIDETDEFLLYVVNPRYPYYEMFRKYSHVRIRPLYFDNPLLRIPLLGIVTLVDRLDLLHVNYYAPPLFGGKLIVTVHDLSFLSIPDCFTSFERIKNELLIPKNMRTASGILTVSEYSRAEIIRNYGILPDRVAVTYNGVRSIFSAAGNLDTAKGTVSRYGVAGDYILFVGRLNKRKNLRCLIDAFGRLKSIWKVPHKLVVAGIRDFMPPEELRFLNSSPFKADVVFTGFLPEEDLPSFYTLADVFVFPSLYEGFGLPCLEAMACGCPVISSRCTSIPEVVGEAGILIDPLDVKEIASAMGLVISNRNIRESMVAKGLEQAKRFNWEQTAEETLKAFRRFSAQ